MKRLLLMVCLVNFCLFANPIAVNFAISDQPTPNSQSDYEMLFWESVKDSENIDMYRAYIKKYPNGIFADLAKIKIKALEKVTPKAPMPTPVQKKDAGNPINPPSVLLRSTPVSLEEKELVKMLQQYNFCDLKRNKKGEFQNVFIDNNDGTITDKTTGLIWEKAGSWRKRSFKSAKAYIRDLNYYKFAGKSHWRLPTLEELASLIEIQYTEKEWFFIDPIFGDPGGDWLDRCWSSDNLKPFGGGDESAWFVNFYKGTIMAATWANNLTGSYELQFEKNNVRAVCSLKPMK